MYIYIVFLLFLGFLYLIQKRKKYNSIEYLDKKNENEKIAFMVFLFIFLLFALRHPSMGNDLHYLSDNGYLGSFDILNSYSWKKILQIQKYMNYERGYIILNKVIGSVWKNKQFFIAVIAFLSLFPVYIFIKDNSESVILSYIVFFGTPVFLMYYSGLRQIIAIGICLYSIILIKKRKLIWFILLVLFATLFHSSAWVFFVAYPLFYYKPSKKIRWLSVVILGIIYAFRAKLFPFLSAFIKENAEVQDTGAFTLYVVFVLIYIVCILFSNQDERCREELNIDGFLNLFYIACVVQSFAGLSNIAMRVGYYFAIVLIVLLPNVIKTTSVRGNQMVISGVVTISFALFGLYSLKNTFWANAVPYYFFWQNV